MTSIEIKGKKLTEAVELGAKELGVGLNDVEYEIVDEGSKGFLGLVGARPSRIIVRLAGAAAAEEAEKNRKKREEKVERPAKKSVKKEQPKPEAKAEYKRAESKAVNKEDNRTVKKADLKPAEEEKPVKPPVTESAPVRERPIRVESEETRSARMNLTDDDKTKILAAATNFLEEVFAAMNMDVALDVKFEDNKQIFINMTGTDMGVVIGKRGQTLDSLQYLTNLVVNKGSYPYMNVTLDTEGYRERRMETLEHLAFNLAKKAKHLRKNVVLEPMNPYERRIIHSTLQNDRYVTTYSEGTEPYRYVVISPKSNYRGGYRDRRNNVE